MYQSAQTDKTEKLTDRLTKLLTKKTVNKTDQTGTYAFFQKHKNTRSIIKC